ncbi:hypothetical protein ACHAW5_005792 [Stephanodiscus triporus]|uniref:Uncharacterized protein n=1 Tax=Stephanodiscus triporus TaxID=2934178 RepID=A0ABD3PU98_9STRA
MRPHNIIAILGILSSGTVDAQSTANNATEIPDVSPCPVCPDGLTVSGSSVIQAPEANGMTCDRLLVVAADGVRQEVCDEMLLAEEYCCPALAANPCDVCSDGITVAETVSVAQGSSKTCGDLIVDSRVVEEGTDLCTQMKVTELACCPAALTDPCPLCVGGTTNGGRVVSGKTCDEHVADAALVEESSAVCPQLQLLESACCPGDDASTNATSPTVSPSANATAFESCLPLVCPDGITADAAIVIGNGKTCGGLLADAEITAATSVGCSLMQDAQLTCCPTAAVNPCPVCPDGITVDPTVAVGSAGKTCADLLVDKLNVEENSDTCTGMYDVAGPVCCPPATNTGPTTAPTAGGNVTGTDVDVDATEAPVAPTSAPIETPSPTVIPIIDTIIDTTSPTSGANITAMPTEEEVESSTPELTFEKGTAETSGSTFVEGLAGRRALVAVVFALCGAAFV